MTSRRATADDAAAITTTIALAFASDPTWAPALRLGAANDNHVLPFWRYFVEGALRFDLSTVIDGDNGEIAAAALWIAPGEPELSHDQEAGLTTLIEEALDSAGAASMFELWNRFDANHPAGPPHGYLSMLAAHPDHRGRGIAQGLLGESLAEFDRAGIPTFLESSNPANNHRYVRAGYDPVGEILAPSSGAPVALMWRDAR
jgi:ribosomal protein S18 acetylase RimI-like enzyme